jgi:cobalt-zinc-cadmium efflux system protein
MFLAGRKGDANIRGAFLHMASDAGVSFGVVIAGFAILATGWLWLDPAISLLIGVVVLIGTWGLLKDAVNLAMDAVPASINVADVRQYFMSLPGVFDVHDLHVWAMSTTEVALTAHLVMEEPLPSESLLARVPGELHEKFGIDHPTLQIERQDGEFPCAFEPAHVV